MPRITVLPREEIGVAPNIPRPKEVTRSLKGVPNGEHSHARQTRLSACRPASQPLPRPETPSTTRDPLDNPNDPSTQRKHHAK